MRSPRPLLTAVAIASVVVVADQIAKAAVTGQITPGTAVDVIGPLRLTLSYNDGVAFGLAGGNGPLVIALAALALMILRLPAGPALAPCRCRAPALPGL